MVSQTNSICVDKYHKVTTSAHKQEMMLNIGNHSELQTTRGNATKSANVFSSPGTETPFLTTMGIYYIKALDI